MISDKLEKNINKLLYTKIDFLIKQNNLNNDYNNILEKLRNNNDIDFYKFDDIYNFIKHNLFYNKEFTEIEDIETIQKILENKFNKFIDKNYIKNIFIEIKRNYYNN
jgi:hypothetical protein